MNKRRLLVALGVLSTALAGCGAEPGGAPGVIPGHSGAAGGAAAMPGVGAAGGGSLPGGLPGASGSGEVCVPGLPATTQIPRLLNRQYEAVVRDLLGVSGVGSDNKTASQLLVADSDGPMTPDAWRIYREVGEQIARSVMTGPNRSRFIGCDPAAAGCMEQTIRSFGRKAFRRPLDDAELARFQKLAQTTPAGTPEEIAETTLLAFLVSPSFLLLPELTTAQDPMRQGIQLSGHEVATRLSFLLWGSVPDDALNAAADADRLQTKPQILAEAQRMIGVRDKTGPLVAAFHRDWVQMNNANAHWWKADHDTKTYPLFSAAAKPSWQAELDAFFQEVAFSGGSFDDLLLSNVAYVNADNAAIYGLDPSKYGAELMKVELDAAQRPGFMTRAGFLSSYAGYDATSPILRGAFISVYMLGVNPGPPIPGATMMKVSGDFETQRGYVEALTKPAACTGCHAIINPPGFALENYDGIGKWQTVDPRGGAIDASVTTATVNFGGGVTKQIASPVQLMQAIAETPKAKQLYAEAWVSYAFGREPNANDRCVVDQLDAKLSQNGYSILGLLADLSQADSFRLRARQTP
jgi:Protein of unknown function (DUF1592)/Protein of unknown function (DUF1588)/Protein of unknown function (DUF1595)/Protein of unknown function (DUF1585)